MPTLEHNGLIEMFRENPAIAPRFLSTVLHIDVPSHAAVRIADSALDQMIPIEFRADLVLELLDDAGNIVLAVVLETQRDKKQRKKFVWPVYTVVSRAERECPAVVLVIAPDPDVAAWASEKINLGLSLGFIQPLVLGPATLPIVTDLELAKREIELSILSAMAHGNGPDGLAVLAAAFGAIGGLDRDHASVYFQIVWNVLREPMQRALEALVMEQQTEGKATFPPFAQQLIDRGLREGELKGLRDALTRLLARSGITITDEERARIQACDDSTTLDRWIENVIGAKTAADVLS